MNGATEYVLFICTFLSLASGAECLDSSQQNQKTPVELYQTQLMLRCISDNFQWSKAHRDRMWNYLCTGKPNTSDPCEWRGVTCTNNEMTSLIFVSTDSIRNPLDSPWSIDMDWLPSTLQYVHLTHARQLDGWLAERLPRALLYFNSSCSLTNGVITKRQIHFRNLPPKMEEMQIFHGWFSGTVWISALPNTMRACVLRTGCIRRVYVESQNLPKSLEMIVINGIKDRAEVISMDGQLDERVSTSFMDTSKHSDTCITYNRKALEIFSQFN